MAPSWNSSLEADAIIRVPLNGGYEAVVVSGRAWIASGADVRHYIYRGAGNWRAPLWETWSADTAFNVTIPYSPGDELFFATDSGSSPYDAWAHWDIRFQGVSIQTLAISCSDVINQETIQVADGAELEVNGSVTTNGLGSLASPAFSRTTVTGDLLGNTRNSSLYTPQGTLLFDGSGTAAAPQLLEVMGRDLGLAAAGFTHNFVYGSLSLASPTYVKLVDQAANTASGSPEAIYVNSLAVAARASLDLNGLHLYVRAAQVDGAVLNGTIEQIPDSGPIALNTPTSGAIDPAGQLDEWTILSQRGRVVTVAVNTGSGGAPAPVHP
jgi:hypothetical protein